MAATVVAEARSAGVTVDELQIDYDCPEPKLDGYRRLVTAVRGRLPDCNIVITALPSWLDRRSFRSLVTEAGGYVLQVHSLVLPKSIDDIPPLCDPVNARAWVERAARIGVPFRVALPTYGYLLSFDEAGRYVGLVNRHGDGLLAGQRCIPLQASPADMASLVASWSQDRPAALVGVIWYRLPVAHEPLNWPWPTLQTVMEGREPRPDLQAIIRTVEPGLVEIDLHNAGAAPALARSAVVIGWPSGEPIASDGVGGYAVIRMGDDRLRVVPMAAAELPAGEGRMIAWVRFEDEQEVTANVEPLDD